MHMSMIDRLPRHLSAIHADIEACYGSISFQNVGPELIQHDAEGAALWLKKIEIGQGVPSRDEQSMESVTGNASRIA
jgi:hypothetical protein